MKRSIFLLLFLYFATCASIASAAVKEEAKETPLFGPKKFDVVERYGIENRYKETFRATDGVYLIKIQNGEKPNEASDYIEFTLNGKKLVRDDGYAYPFIACLVKLQKENSFEFMLRDSRPVGSKRPKLPARHAVITVIPVPLKMPEGVYGVTSSDTLQNAAGLLKNISVPESLSLAVMALNLTNDGAARAEAVRKLAGRKDQSAREFLAFLYSDERLFENIRAEAALALGALRNKESLPLLLQGLLHDQEKIRVSSARALSFYSNDDTGEPFMTMIRRLDSVRMNTALQAIADAGWKHLAAFKALAESEDLYVAKAGIKLLGGARDPETVDYLLTLLGAPRDGAAGAIITALGDSGDPRALEALSRIAGDPSERAGVEAELGAALAALGDQRSAALIGDMIKNTSEPDTRRRLAAAYRKLTGMSYQGE